MGRWEPTQIDERFWSKVEKSTPDKCWLWKGSCFRQGYGAFAVTTKIIVKAHRMAYELLNGMIPDDVILRHKCDNPPCCNPGHLLTGTQKDNARDRMERGRCKKTSRKGWHMLKPEDVRCIRELREEGMPRIHLAQWFGITEHSITGICQGRTYKNVS